MTGAGRFDVSADGRGTCYLAEAALGAWIEAFRKRMLLPEPEWTAVKFKLSRSDARCA
jgi:hypothetical protein